MNTHGETTTCPISIWNVEAFYSSACLYPLWFCENRGCFIFQSFTSSHLEIICFISLPSVIPTLCPVCLEPLLHSIQATFLDFLENVLPFPTSLNSTQLQGWSCYITTHSVRCPHWERPQITGTGQWVWDSQLHLYSTTLLLSFKKKKIFVWKLHHLI